MSSREADHKQYGKAVCRPISPRIWRLIQKNSGPIVRINPYELHIQDFEFYNELYSPTNKLDKYGWSTKLAGADGSSIATVPHDLHKLRRNALSP